MVLNLLIILLILNTNDILMTNMKPTSYQKKDKTPNQQQRTNLMKTRCSCYDNCVSCAQNLYHSPVLMNLLFLKPVLPTSELKRDLTLRIVSPAILSKEGSKMNKCDRIMICSRKALKKRKRTYHYRYHLKDIIQSFNILHQKIQKSKELHSSCQALHEEIDRVISSNNDHECSYPSNKPNITKHFFQNLLQSCMNQSRIATLYRALERHISKYERYCCFICNDSSGSTLSCQSNRIKCLLSTLTTNTSKEHVVVSNRTGHNVRYSVKNQFPFNNGFAICLKSKYSNKTDWPFTIFMIGIVSFMFFYFIKTICSRHEGFVLGFPKEPFCFFS